MNNNFGINNNMGQTAQFFVPFDINIMNNMNNINNNNFASNNMGN
jgi:hypothetical protein